MLFRSLFTFVLASSFATGLCAQDFREEIQDCVDIMDHMCVFELNLKMFESTAAKPLLEDGHSPSLSTTQLMISLEEILPDVSPSEGRSYVERTLAMVEDKHGQTQFLRGELYLFLYEQCVAEGDDECVENTGQFLCKNKQNLAAPFLFGPAKDAELMGRFADIMVAQECEVVL